LVEIVPLQVQRYEVDDVCGSELNAVNLLL